ncbi:hypothetical protein BGZ72_001894 [Mortierella alpina]|nr:hypothetical protein BGZ72_001894 [Mortierella alpina]
MVLPRLHSLGLGGTTAGLIPSLGIAVEVFSERLLSLTITLQVQYDGEAPNRRAYIGNNRITFQRPLPRLTELVLRDKAIFELDAKVLTERRCPALRILDLGVDAEQSGQGCTAGFNWTIKWCKVWSQFKQVKCWNDDHMKDGENALQELRLRGFFPFTLPVIAEIIQSFKHLKRLYLGETTYITRNQSQDMTWVNNLFKSHKDLIFLQATRWQTEGLKDPLPPGLELSLTGSNYVFDHIDEQEVVSL